MFKKIPFFKGKLQSLNPLEIILSSFCCEHCGNKNTEIQFGGKIGELGISYELNVVNPINLSRQVVKSEFATIKIPELDLEIPPQTQKGTINTIEGFLMKSIEGLSALQEERKNADPDTAAKVESFIDKLREFMEGRHFPFTFEMIDPSGNSHI